MHLQQRWLQMLIFYHMKYMRFSKHNATDIIDGTFLIILNIKVEKILMDVDTFMAAGL